MTFYVNAIKELQKIYKALNEKYYDNTLPDIVITIQSSPKTYGHYAKEHWGKEGTENKYDEINISAEHLSRPLENLGATLNHECIHLWCAINGIKDTSNNNVYHNKRFKAEAEKRGLIIKQAKTIGWSITEPTEEFKNFIYSLDIDTESFSFARTSVFAKLLKGNDDDKDDKKEEKKKKTTTYTCPVCESKVRGNIGLHIRCIDCDEEMESKYEETK